MILHPLHLPIVGEQVNLECIVMVHFLLDTLYHQTETHCIHCFPGIFGGGDCERNIGCQFQCEEREHLDMGDLTRLLAFQIKTIVDKMVYLQ
jgi:hypothetical protein